MEYSPVRYWTLRVICYLLRWTAPLFQACLRQAVARQRHLQSQGKAKWQVSAR